MKFESEKSLFTSLVYLGLIILMLAIFIVKILNSPPEFEFSDLVILAPVVLLTWFWFGTSYSIKNEFIHYKSGFIFGKISIQSIIKIEKNRTLWIGLRPAPAAKGLIIKYEKFSEIYFSPVDKEKFVGLLQTVNPVIEVKDFGEI